MKTRPPAPQAPPTYLLPYVQATAQYGASFDALLWASPQTQEARFAAAVRAADPGGRVILDVGCGRGDMLRYLLDRGIHPARYIGLEAVPELAAAARRLPGASVIEGDFVQTPSLMAAGAELIYFSGSLNTLDADLFYPTVRSAFAAASQALVMNFLSTPALAGRRYLYWHSPKEVLSFARGLTPLVRLSEDYLPGDCTAVLTHPAPPSGGTG